MRVNFTWDANPEPEVIGYKIYAGRATGVYNDAASPKNMGNVTSGYYEVFQWGVWYFALTAYTSEAESGFSSEIQTWISPLQLSIAVQNARLNAVETTIGASPVLKIWSGAPPANCAAPDAGTQLATLVLPSDWMAAAASASKGKLGVWQDLAGDASGNAGHFRIYDSGGSPACHMQGVVSVTGGGGDLTLNTVAISPFASVTITSFSMTDNNT